MAASVFDLPRVDLRRRDIRELAETIIDRSRFVMPEDRVLISAVYREGLTASEVAVLRGKPPKSIRRRIRQVVSKVLSPQFEFVMRHRDAWPAPRRRVATACILHGRTMRDASRHLRTSLHAIRTEMAIVNALYQNASAGEQRSSVYAKVG